VAKTIAWVDDDNDLLYESLAAPLEWAGYRVLRYPTIPAARAALDQIREADLLLLDMILPDRPEDEQAHVPYNTGVTWLEELRRDPALGAIPVIVLSVVSVAQRPELSERLKTLGVITVLNKPILPSKLKQAIVQAIGT